jgi:hypothetical protein
MLLNISYNINTADPIAVQFKVYYCGWSIVGITGSSSGEAVDVSKLVFVLCCVGKDLCDWLICRPEEIYRFCLRVSKEPQT